MRKLVAMAFAFAALGLAAGNQTFTGVVTDSFCPKGDHKQMHMGDTDAACAQACVKAMRGKYMLYDGKTAYTLSDQTTPAKFAATKVTVTGTLDAKTKTIQVEKITAAQ
jgi:hypothetical protein